MADFLKKIQEKPKYVREIIFWVLVITFAIIFLGFWLLAMKQRVENFDKEKALQEIKIPELENQFKNLPEIKLPEFNKE